MFYIKMSAWPESNLQILLYYQQGNKENRSQKSLPFSTKMLKNWNNYKMFFFAFCMKIENKAWHVYLLSKTNKKTFSIYKPLSALFKRRQQHEHSSDIWTFMKLNHRVGPVLSVQSDKCLSHVKVSEMWCQNFPILLLWQYFIWVGRETQHKMSITCPWVRHIMTLTFQRT